MERMHSTLSENEYYWQDRGLNSQPRSHWHIPSIAAHSCCRTRQLLPGMQELLDQPQPVKSAKSGITNQREAWRKIHTIHWKQTNLSPVRFHEKIFPSNMMPCHGSCWRGEGQIDFWGGEKLLRAIQSTGVVYR